jgi:hypothetical protein
MAMDGNDGHGGHGGDGPPKSARIVWLVGLVLLALVIGIAIRSFVAGPDAPVVSGAGTAAPEGSGGH